MEYTVPLPLKVLFVPLVTVISVASKFVTESLKVMVTGIGDKLVGSNAVEESVTAGAVVSIVIFLPADAELTFPAISVALTVIVWFPLASAEEVMLQLPPEAVAEPNTVVPSVS